MFQDDSEYKAKNSSHVSIQKTLFGLIVLMLVVLGINYHQRTVSALQAENAVLQAQLAEQEATVLTLEAQVDEHEAEVLQLQQELDEREQQTTDNEAEVSERDEQILELQDRIDEQYEQIIELQTQITALQSNPQNSNEAPVSDTERVFGYVIATMCNPIPAGEASRSHYPNIMMLPMNAVVIESNSSNLSRFYNTLPEDWTATFQNNTDLVICASINTQVLETCSYQEGTVDRVQEELDLVVLNVLNASWIGTAHLEGSNPEQCPASYPQGGADIVGAVSPQSFNNSIRTYINGGQ